MLKYYGRTTENNLIQCFYSDSWLDITLWLTEADELKAFRMNFTKNRRAYRFSWSSAGRAEFYYLSKFSPDRRKLPQVFDTDLICTYLSRHGGDLDEEHKGILLKVLKKNNGIKLRKTKKKGFFSLFETLMADVVRILKI